VNDILIFNNNFFKDQDNVLTFNKHFLEEFRGYPDIYQMSFIPTKYCNIYKSLAENKNSRVGI